MDTTDRRVLLHILKNNPQNGEVYITWEGETFVGKMHSINVTKSVNSLTEFNISGFIVEK
jgi:hypothetical protein